MKFTEGVKYFFRSYTVDCTISLFYSCKEFVTNHGKGNCEETCHQGTVEGNWKSGVDPKPAVVKYMSATTDLCHFQRKQMLSIINRPILLQIFHGWWTYLVNHTGHLHPLHSVRFYFCASIESTERPVAGRLRRLL